MTDNKVTLKEAIDAARASFQPQVPSVPIQFDGEPCIDALPIMSLADSYLRPKPDGVLEVKDGAVGLVGKPTTFPDFTSAYSSDYTPKAASFNAQTHDGSRHHYIENYGGTMEQGFKTRPMGIEDITTEMLDAAPFLLRNMVEENGRTIKQNNMERNHTIPIDALVEMASGVRMFVVMHSRDCDGTPLYGLCTYKQEEYADGDGHLDTGHVEDSLRVIKQPSKLPPVQLKRWDSVDAIVANHWGIEVDDIDNAVCAVAPRMESNGEVSMERDVPLSEWLADVAAMSVWGYADMTTGTINYWINGCAPVTMEHMVEFFAHELHHLTFHPVHLSEDHDIGLKLEQEAGLAGELAEAAYRMAKAATITRAGKDAL